jgi:predicted transport protein
LIAASGKARHGEIVPWLKSEYGLSHGTAHRLALVAIDRMKGDQHRNTDPKELLYPENRRHLLPLHEALLREVQALGDDIEVAPKKGYLSLRRRKQFAMLQPAARHIDLGLILADAPEDARLESADTFNALFTNRVRVRSIDDIDAELVGWLREAYEAAG